MENPLDNLTKKEKGFVKDYVETGNGTQSVLKNYDTKDRDVAGVIASQNLGKLRIQNAIKSIAEQIPDELLLQVHLEGLKASTIVNDIEKPDYAIRHKYLDTAHKIKGSYAPEKSVNLNLTADITNNEDLELLAQQINELATHKKDNETL